MSQTTEFTVGEPASLLQFLLTKLAGKGRNKVKGLLTHRQIAVDGKIATRHDQALVPGQVVSILNVRRPDKSTMHGIRILFEDASLIVVDKPPGLLSIATEEERELTAYFILTEYVRHDNAKARIHIVHRLDRDTSGVMMFAKTEEVQQALQNNWKDAVSERSYIALVEGIVTPEKQKLESWLQETKTKTMYVGKPGEGFKAVLHYKVLETAHDYSLLEVRLETGKKNQIRVQLQSIGHSIVGDKRYGSKRNPLGRLGLHARVLGFIHPVTGEQLRFETPIPAGFRRVMATGKDVPSQRNKVGKKQGSPAKSKKASESKKQVRVKKASD